MATKLIVWSFKCKNRESGATTQKERKFSSELSVEFGKTAGLGWTAVHENVEHEMVAKKDRRPAEQREIVVRTNNYF